MPYFSFYQAVAALKILVLSIRDYGNDKATETPEALPGFLVDRLGHYIALYRDYLARHPDRDDPAPTGGA